jgi:hypothetical protein
MALTLPSGAGRQGGASGDTHRANTGTRTNFGKGRFQSLKIARDAIGEGRRQIPRAVKEGDDF